MPIWSAEIKELERLYESFKGRSPGLDKELERLINASDENMVLVYARRSLEVIITDLCEKELKRPRRTEPLQGIIDKLNREQKVPSHIIVSMQYLNSLSAFGAHPKEFEPEQVKPVLFNLTTIIKWYLKYKSEKFEAEERYKVQGAGYKVQEEGYKVQEEGYKLQGASYRLQGTGDGGQRMESREGRAGELKETSKKSKKKLIFLISGILLVVAIVVVAMFVFNVIGKKESKEIEKSIAVLPFINDSPDQENVYFINGIMEEVLNNLQTIKDMRVISRSSVEQYRNSNRPTSPEISKKLNVNYIVEGSGQKYGNTFRLRVQLIEAKSDRHLWAKSYEQIIQDPNAFFNIQINIAKSIATELRAIITPEEKQIIEEIPTKNLEAYESYLLGLHFFNKDTEEDILQAIEYFKEAVAQDPEFALAYTRIAKAYTSLIWENWLPVDVYPKAKEAAMKALEINDQLSEAHVALAYVELYYDWDLKDAEKELNKAISLNPNNSGAYELYSTLLDISCRFGEALEKYKQEMALNPNSEKMRFRYGFVLYRATGVDSAILIMEKGVRNDSLNAWRHYFLGYVYLQDGNYIRSIEELKKAVELDPVPQPYYFYLGIAYNKAGKPDETRKILEKLNTLEKENRKVSLGKALLLAELGEKDQAINWLEKAYEEKHQYLLYLKSIPAMFSTIRSDPRFLEIYHWIWPDG